MTLLCVAVLLQGATFARVWKQALPGYQFSFPRDHASHEEYKTEWWYYTGHLHADDGTTYGYELTFFRIGMDVPDGVKDSPWTVDDAYMAHFAVSDFAKPQFFHKQRLTRSGVNFAGAQQGSYEVWNQNWRVKRMGDVQQLKANSSEYQLDLNLTSQKKPTEHGENGVSQKAGCVGCASHYYSLTRMITEGTIRVGAKTKRVRGLTWMDHEFGSNQLTKEQVGWDWFSLQLDDETELMLYVMRRKDGSLDPHSSGTFVERNGSTQHLALSDYTIKSDGTWKSPASKATYPMGWRVKIPSRNLELRISTTMPQQELATESGRDVTYWEGACTVEGTAGGKAIKGQAYVEMTGYASAFSQDI